MSCGSYVLRLADGRRWRLASAQGCLAWLRRLASIMELESGPGVGSRTLIFLRPGEFEHLKRDAGVAIGPGLNLPAENWTTHEVGYLRFKVHRRVPHIVCEVERQSFVGMEYCLMGEAFYPIFREVVRNGGLPIHAALVELNGKGILLGGPGGMGKSTCAQRIPAPWRALGDDRALLVRTRLRNYAAHPLPTWSKLQARRGGPTWHVEKSVPVCAVFLLDRGKVDRAVPIRQGEAAVKFCQRAHESYGAGWRELPTPAKRVFNLELYSSAEQITRTIPVFTLHVTLKGQYWREIERVLPKSAFR